MEPCLAKNGDYSASLLLPRCETSKQEWCISNVAITPKASEKINGRFIRQVAGRTTPEFPSLGFPIGSTVSLWDFPSVEHGGNGTTYAAYVNIRISKGPNQEPVVNRMNGTLLPYSEIQGTSSLTGQVFNSPSIREEKDSEGVYRVRYTNGTLECAWTEPNLCGLIEEFPNDVTVSMSLRVSKKITGWLMGRMNDPLVNVVEFNKSMNILTINAKPVNVPQFYATAPIQKLTKAMRETFEVDGFFEKDPRGLRSSQTNYAIAFRVLSAWQDAAENRASGSITSWSFSTTSSGSGSKCLQNSTQLQGLVTTNAMVYEGIAPSFQNGFLNYKVAGMHLNADGKEFRGDYNLLMKKSVAQCLYNFSDAPLTANVTVISNGEEQKISTTVLKEFESGSETWLKLSVSGITFSAPILRVRFEQAVARAGKKEVLQKSTITCFQGKNLKKVTAVAPKCPTGFKKK